MLSLSTKVQSIWFSKNIGIQKYGGHCQVWTSIIIFFVYTVVDKNKFLASFAGFSIKILKYKSDDVQEIESSCNFLTNRSYPEWMIDQICGDLNYDEKIFLVWEVGNVSVFV